jgi:hypothetical protein
MINFTQFIELTFEVGVRGNPTKFDFFVFPIFASKLGHLKYGQNFLMLQTLKLNNEKRQKSSFYEEKSLVGLAPLNHFLFQDFSSQSRSTFRGRGCSNGG